ncbi:mycothiol transferase [Gordonia sp. NPDC003424]
MAGTYTPVTLTVEVTSEREDLLTLLTDQRAMFLVPMRGITEEQARLKTTVSDLTLGGLLKHVTMVTQSIADEIRERDENAVVDVEALGDAYALADDETVAGWLTAYEQAGAAIDHLVADAESLDDLVPQATAPWQPERQWWPIRKMILHLLRETAHHSGHADILREALDGQTTMAALYDGPTG